MEIISGKYSQKIKEINPLILLKIALVKENRHYSCAGWEQFLA
jgi:hypothetical protein